MKDSDFLLKEFDDLSAGNAIDVASDQFFQYRKRLIEYVNYLLDNDVNQLIHHLYRLDVSEQKIGAIMKDPIQQGEKIADSIIERQIQKVHTRKKYKTDSDEDWIF